jgi:HPt (histidine-containing phosphotransfer) domain-containing protein
MTDFAARMAALRERFLAQARVETDAVAAHAREGDHAALRDLCHGLAGRAGMFGFKPLGNAARDVEEAIDAGLDDARLQPLVAQLLAQLQTLPHAAA